MNRRTRRAISYPVLGIGAFAVLLWMVGRRPVAPSSQPRTTAPVAADDGEAPSDLMPKTVSGDGGSEASVRSALRESASGVIHGTVRWPDGKPVAVALLTWTRHVDKRAADIPASKDDGSFVIDGLSQGQYSLVARKDLDGELQERGRGGRWLAIGEFSVPGPSTIDLVLGPMELIRGRVLGPDRLGMQSFWITAIPDVDDFASGAMEIDALIQSPDGAFEIAGLTPGVWSVQANHDEFRSPRRISVPYAGTLEFETVRTVEITGIVVDSNGEHARGKVVATWQGSAGRIDPGKAEERWGTGYFKLQVPATIVELRASSDEGSGEPLLLDVTSGQHREGIIVRVK